MILLVLSTMSLYLYLYVEIDIYKLVFFLPDRWTCSYSLQWVLILTPLCSCQNKKLNILTMNQVTLTIKRRIKQMRDHTFKAFIWVDFTTQDLSARNQVWILPGEVFCHVFFLVSAAWTLCCICVRVCPCVCACVNTYTWHIKVWLVLLWQFVVMTVSWLFFTRSFMSL